MIDIRIIGGYLCIGDMVTDYRPKVGEWARVSVEHVAFQGMSVKVNDKEVEISTRKGVKPVNNEILVKIREYAERSMHLVLEDGIDQSLGHDVIQIYLMLQMLNKIESMSLALDAILDHKAAEWHEREIKV